MEVVDVVGFFSGCYVGVRWWRSKVPKEIEIRLGLGALWFVHGGYAVVMMTKSAIE